MRSGQPQQAGTGVCHTWCRVVWCHVHHARACSTTAVPWWYLRCYLLLRRRGLLLRRRGAAGKVRLVGQGAVRVRKVCLVAGRRVEGVRKVRLVGHVGGEGFRRVCTVGQGGGYRGFRRPAGGWMAPSPTPPPPSPQHAHTSAPGDSSRT